MSDRRRSWYTKAKTFFQTPKFRGPGIFVPEGSYQLSPQFSISSSPPLPPRPGSDQMQKLREPPVQIKDITHSPPSSSHYKPNTFCTTCTAFLSRLSVILNESDDRIRSTVSEELPYHQSA